MPDGAGVFAGAMVGHLRSLPAVRATVCLAALLSVSLSAGLHPEPAGLANRDARNGAAAVPQGGASGGPEHVCQVCVLHFACSLVLAGPAVPAMRLAGTPVAARVSGFLGRIERSSPEGRAPPVAS